MAGSTTDTSSSPIQWKAVGVMAAAPFCKAACEGATQPVHTPMGPQSPQVPMPEFTAAPYVFGETIKSHYKDMETQLAATSRLLSQKAIDGVIFHCTPLVDMELDAVRVAREWVRENKERKWGQMI